MAKPVSGKNRAQLGAPGRTLAEAEALDSLREALNELRQDIRTRIPRARSQGVDRPRGDRTVEGFALFDELRVHLARIGLRERSGEIDEFGMDRDLIDRMRPLLDFMATRYWRVELTGREFVPREGPVLFVANRSGLLPYDGWMLAHLVETITKPGPRPRFMVDQDWVAMPFLQPALARVGGVLACPENAHRLLGRGRSLVIFPEGMRGAIKTFDQRYRLQGFGHHALLEAALDRGVPVVPVGIVGAEEAQPMLFPSYLAAWGLGLPFLPVTPTFPMLGPLGLLPLPSRWSVGFGPALGAEAIETADSSAEGLAGRAMGLLRDRIQARIEAGREARLSPWA